MFSKNIRRKNGEHNKGEKDRRKADLILRFHHVTCPSYRSRKEVANVGDTSVLLASSDEPRMPWNGLGIWSA
jgi:hypothetical protein